MNLTRGINLRKIAEAMPGASGAEIKVVYFILYSLTDKQFYSWSSSYDHLRDNNGTFNFQQGVCTEAGMYALRERRVHVTQEDFDMAVAKVYVPLFS